MKRRNSFTFILSALILVSVTCFAIPVWADDYTYRVTISGGNQGEGSETVQVKYGDTITIDPGIIKIKNDKYYLKGFHVAGQESPVVQAGDIPAIHEDLDLVATYGIRQSMVKYTVRYVDQNEQELINAKTFYGNVGDKPVLAFTMIEGYKPDAYALTKTLSENEAENQFVFSYSKTQEEEPEENSGSEEQEPGDNESGEDSEAGNEDSESGNDDSESEYDDTDNENEDADGNRNTETVNAGNRTVTGATGNIFQGNTASDDSSVDDTEADDESDVVDLDDQDVAKADGSGNEDGKGNGAEKGGMNAGFITGAVIGIAVLAILIALLMKRRKSDNQ